MRRTSLIERVRLFGLSSIDMIEVLGRSMILLFYALLGRGGIGGGFGLLLKQLHSVGVMSLVIITVSGIRDITIPIPPTKGKLTILAIRFDPSEACLETRSASISK